MSVPKVMVEISANSAKLVTEAEKANKALGGLSRSAVGMQKSLSLISYASVVNLGQQALSAGQRIYGMARQVASSINDIDRMSKIAGISTDAFQKMSYAAKMSDVEAGDLAIGLKKLSSGMDEASRGTGQAASWFQAMGISVKDSAGNLKPLDQMMGEIAGKFSQWEDGPRKIAIAVDLFGRSGQNLIPYLNQGAAGLKKLYEEAERLGIVLDVKKGTELEDRLKRAEAWWTSLWRKIVIGAYEAIEAVEKFNRTGGPEAGVNIFPRGPKQSSWATRWPAETRFKLPVGVKTQPPEATGKVIDASKEALAAWDAEVARANELGEVFLARQELTEISFWNQRKALENLAKIEGERAQQLANDMFPSLEVVTTIQDAMTEGAEKLRVKLLEMQNLVVDFGWEDYASGIRDAASESTRALSAMALAANATAPVIKTVWDDLAQNLSSAWTSNMVNMIRGTESASEKIKGFFQNIGDVFLSMVSKMITQWLLLGDLEGKKGGWGSKGGGWGGLFGGLLGWLGGKAEGGIFPGTFTPIKQFAGGGVADRPTLGLIGEGGGSEAVVPLKGGSIPVEMNGEGKGGGGTTIIVLPHNYDKSFSDMVQRNPGAVIEEIFKNARAGGAMKDIVRSVR